MEVLAHRGPCEGTGKVNMEKHWLCQRSMAKTHVSCVCNSIKSQTDYVERDTHAHLYCTRTRKVIKHLFDHRVPDCDLISIDTQQKHMLLIIHKCPNTTQ